jgi:N-acetylneuraminate synthase
VPSVELLASYSPAWIKLASASITDHDVLRAVAATGKPIVLSTGMATYAEISAALDTLGDAYPSQLILAHTTSSYPCPDEDVNLAAMDRLRDFMCPVGYSGHEDGIALTFAAVVRGACWVERHCTMNRAAWHKDHRASLEPAGLQKLVRDIRRYERAVGDGVKRLMPSEAPFLSLRRVS